ncbi:YveK family protein [Arthrobacter sp. MDB2-24]
MAATKNGEPGVPEIERGQTVRLSEVFDRIVKRWRLILAITLVGAVLGAAYSLVQRDQYTASATLTVSPITTNPFNAGAVNQQINITTERAILNSREVARIAADKLDRDVSPTQLLAGSEVAAPSGSQVLEVTVTADSPDDAAAFANALADAYLEFRAQGAAEVALGFIDDLDRRIAALTQSDKLNAADRAELSALQDQRSSLSLVGANPGRIIGEAAVPETPSSPGIAVWVIIGTAVGLLVGTTCAFLRDRFDPLLRSVSKLRERTGARVIEFQDERDRVAARWAIRAVSERSRGQDAAKPLRVVFLDTRQTSAEPLVETLKDEFRRAGLIAETITVDDLLQTPLKPPREAVSAGHVPDLLLLDASTVHDEPGRASVVEGAASVLIVASSTTRTAAFDRLLSDVQATHTAPLLLFVGQTSQTGSEAPASRARRRTNRSVASLQEG